MGQLCVEINKPNTWSSQSGNIEAKEVEVNYNELSEVRRLLSGESLKHLKRVTRVQNPYLYGRYLLRKEEYTKKGEMRERTLLHATAASKVSSIIADNLDWRLANRVKFGRGVSFSGCASYANKECSRDNGNDRAVIVCDVLICNVSSGCSSTILPCSGTDTTLGNRGKVFVKYYDDEFYPKYVAYYTNTETYTRRYNRFDMYDIE